MKKVLLLSVCLACTVWASPEATNLVSSAQETLQLNAGGDFRIRQELMDNLPGNPGDSTAMSPVARNGNKNQFRLRPRVWFEVEGGPFRLYTRLADEFREYPVTNHIKRKKRAYNFPDEIILDNLYLEGKGLTADWLKKMGVEGLDFRAGRQDLLEGPHSALGLDRLIGDGTPMDGSRSFFADMIRATFHFTDVRKVDLFALYDSGRNDVRWGTHQSRGRALNLYNMKDGVMDEMGGGIIYSDAAFDTHLPFKLYSLYKRNTSYQSLGRKMPATEVTTLGLLLQPRFNEYWGMELEGARQIGRILSGNRQKTGMMGYVEINYRPDLLKKYKPQIAWCNTYYSGDRHRTDSENNNDTAWDPLWARHTQDSELLVYGTLYANGYWSNMIYSKMKLTMSFGAHHGLYAYTGPMFAATQDHIGHADGRGDSMYKGWLSATRYDFPLRLAPPKAHGWDRFELLGHVVAEVFNPGDYFDSTKPSYFFRWQLEFKF